ncbi:MAG: DUF1178 family protein [Rhodobacteraceae bacterium]|nr:DUF1178 family protein [Paracoccaceae bacterium]
MICYTLKCADGHTFESWFQSADAFDALHARGRVTCSVCGTPAVEKAVMAPRITGARDPAVPKGALSRPASPAEQALAALRRKVEAHTEDVGENFAAEARAIHEGEAPERAIRGAAKPEEATSLIEDGIPVAPLPWGNQRTN